MKKILERKLCQCLWNCGEEVKMGRKYVKGHYSRGRKATPETRKKQSDALKGRTSWNKGLTKENNLIIAADAKKRTGQKRSEESRKKMIVSHTRKTGELARNWRGDKAKLKSKRLRGNKVARELYKTPKPCAVCGILKDGVMIRHHIDDNTKNNKFFNILWLCISHHMQLEMKIDDTITKYRRGLLLKMKVNIKDLKKKGGKGK